MGQLQSNFNNHNNNNAKNRNYLLAKKPPSHVGFSRAAFKTVPEDSIFLKKQSNHYKHSNSEGVPTTTTTAAAASGRNKFPNMSWSKFRVSSISGSATMSSTTRTISTINSSRAVSVPMNNTDNNGNKILDSLSASSSASTSALATVNPDDFPINDLIPMKTWEGQKLCQEDERIRKAFVEFIVGFEWMDQLGVRISEILARKISQQEAAEHILFNDFLVHPKYLSPDQKIKDDAAAKMMRCTQLKVKDSMDVVSFHRSTIVSSCFANDQLSNVMLAILWPLFASSSEFAAVSPYKVGSNSEKFSKPISPSLSPKALEIDKMRRIKDIIYQTVMSLNVNDIEQLLLKGKWVEKVLSTLEDAPFPISVSTADQEKQGFPLIFVNHAFEKMSQYDRSEVLGRSCRILQGRSIEKEYVQKLSHVLSRGLGLKVALTNVRKDRSEFINLLSIHSTATISTRI